MGDLIANEYSSRFEQRQTNLGMSLKGLAVFNEMPPFFRCPFKFADL
jgi:hypothetical protein